MVAGRCSMALLSSESAHRLLCRPAIVKVCCSQLLESLRSREWRALVFRCVSVGVFVGGGFLLRFLSSLPLYYRAPSM